MNQSKLAIRINRKNENHHLWNNNGKWWYHLTLHHPDNSAERRRVPLHTRVITTDRQRRDELFADWAEEVSRKELAA